MKNLVYLFTLLFFTVVLLQCIDRRITSDSRKESQADTTVVVRGKYMMEIPKSYKVKGGLGDDTEFLQIRSKDDSIVLQYEIGETLKPENISNFLNKLRVKRQVLKQIEEWDLIIAFIKTNNKFRDIEGEVYLENKNKIDDLFSFSCSSSQLDNVIDNIKTLVKK